MTESLGEMVGAAFERGEGEPIGDARFLRVFVLESGTVFGLDEHARWAALRPGTNELVAFEQGGQSVFFEAVESRRADFDARVADGAARAGLDPDTVLVHFPSVDLVREILSRQSPHFCRLALHWLLPSELRPLRADIVAIVSNHLLPRPLRDLAERLVVPE